MYRAVAAEVISLYQKSMSVRWFTDPAATGPASISPSLTEFERWHLDAILQFAGNTANANWENLRCLDADGTCMHDMVVGLKEGLWTDLMRAAITRGNGVRQWHNHPSQDSLSHSDWIAAGCCSELEIIALNDRRSIFVGRIVAWDERLHHVLPLLPGLGGDLKFHMGQWAEKRGLDFSLISELKRLTGHVLNSALAMCGSVRYGYQLDSKDQAVIDACSKLDLIEDGKRYAFEEIQKDLSKAPAVPNGSCPSA